MLKSDNNRKILNNEININLRKNDFEKNNNPKKNFLYNVIYQILILIIPLITAPYLSRIIGADGVGVYSYTYSIVYYFMLLVLLGVNNYGNRAIAKIKNNDKEKLSKEFWSIYLLQVIMGLIILIVYTLYMIFFENKYKVYTLIEILFIFSAMFDINWFFFGMEEFKKTITRNTFVKIGSIVLIFLCVKEKNDLWIYTLIMAGMTFISQIILWFFLKNKVQFVRIDIKDINKHIKPNIILFIPVIAVSLYKMMDKIMLGTMSSVVEVGYYENAEKIVSIPLTIITALGTVMLPRISSILAEGNEKKIHEYIYKSIRFVSFLSFPMWLGLMCIGNTFSILYFGPLFEKTGILIIFLSSTIPFIAFANVLRTQYLIPKEMDKIYIKSVSLGAVTNLILNIILIPIYSSIGACIGTIVAEVTVMLYQSIAVRKELDIKRYINSMVPFFIKAVIMGVIVYMLNYIQINDYFRLILQIGLGGTIYSLLNIKYILSIINLKNIKKKLVKNER